MRLKYFKKIFPAIFVASLPFVTQPVYAITHNLNFLFNADEIKQVDFQQTKPLEMPGGNTPGEAADYNLFIKNNQQGDDLNSKKTTLQVAGKDAKQGNIVGHNVGVFASQYPLSMSMYSSVSGSSAYSAGILKLIKPDGHTYPINMGFSLLSYYEYGESGQPNLESPYSIENWSIGFDHLSNEWWVRIKKTNQIALQLKEQDGNYFCFLPYKTEASGPVTMDSYIQIYNQKCEDVTAIKI